MSEKSASSRPSTATATDAARAVVPVPYQSVETSSMVQSDTERTVRGPSLDAKTAVNGEGDGDVERAAIQGEVKKEKEEPVVDPNECRFEGDDDPDDPLNIPFWKKWMAVITVGTGAICV